MKILVFSDSHRSVGGMIDAVEREKPQQIIHLGDILDDAEELSYACPMLPVAMVPGNCDGWTMVPPEKCITLAGKTVLMGHGHTWGVKSGYGAAIAREIADVTIASEDLFELVTLRKISQALMNRIHRNYRFIVGFNCMLIALGVAGVIQPTTSALLHNASPLGISLDSMTDMLKQEQEPGQLPA